LTPTFTQESAASISSGVTIPSISGGVVDTTVSWEYEGADMVASGSYAIVKAPTNNGSRVGNAAFSYQVIFNHDGQVIEIPVNSAVSALVRVWANEQASAYQTVTGNNYLKIDFGSRANRRVIIESDVNLYFGGIIREPTATIMPPTRSAPLKFAVVGDSYSVGLGINTSSNPSAQGYPFTLARMLGLTKFRTYGQSGTGFMNPNVNVGTYRTRIGDMLGYQPDILLLQASVNDKDASYTTNQISTEIAAYIAQAKAGLPSSTIIIGLTPITPTPALRAAIPNLAAATLAAYQAAGILYVDAYSQNWIYGTGKVGATAGDGNSDFYQSSVFAVHPSLAGHQYMAWRMAGGIAPLLKTGL
jgi:lysophospholipase L1-like esterase